MLSPTSFENVDDAERPVALMRAEFAMFGMIDRDERVDAGVARGLKFVELQLALEVGQHAEVDALQADRRLFQIDELDAGNCAAGFRPRLHDAGDAGMPVQGDPHRHGLVQMRRQSVEPAARKRMNGVISNGRAPRCRSSAGRVVSVNWT